jgi:hypothetical protein
MSVCSDAAELGCDDLDSDTHRLLKALTKLAKRRGHCHVIQAPSARWAEEAGIAKHRIPAMKEELLGLRFLREDSLDRLELSRGCSCRRTEMRADLSQQTVELPAQATSTRGVGAASPTGSASMVPSSFGRQEAVVGKERETPSDLGVSPEESALATYLNGADDQTERDARRRRKNSARGLVGFFDWNIHRVAGKAGVTLLPDAVDKQVLAMNLTRWRQGGISAKEIRSMIMTFCDEYPHMHKDKADPGRVFMANRRRLLAEVRSQALIITERDINTLARSGLRYSTAADIKKKGKS